MNLTTVTRAVERPPRRRPMMSYWLFLLCPVLGRWASAHVLVAFRGPGWSGPALLPLTVVPASGLVPTVTGILAVAATALLASSAALTSVRASGPLAEPAR